MFLFIFMQLIISSVCKSEYSEYSLYQVTAFNYHERKVLYDMYLKNKNIFFLNGVTNDAALPMDIVVNHCCTEEFEIDLQNRYIEYYNIYNDQIQDEFDRLIPYSQKLKQNMTDEAETILDWDGVSLWFDRKCKRYSTLKRVSIGTTYEKRELEILKLSTGGGRKPAVFIMGGEQGRDWMSSAIILNFISNLLGNSQEVLLKTFDFYFMPIFNPDGYDYSIKYDRFWTKNRKSFFPHKICPSSEVAVGVNIDQNWFLERSGSVRNAECYSMYPGHKSLTEEETKSLSNFINSIAINLLAFIDLRAFANLVTVPYAESEKHANNQAILMEMLLFATQRVKKEYNVTFKFSNTASCFFNFSGNSADWVKARLNVPLVFTIYMKQEPYIFPHPDHVIPLTDQFTLMVQEMLMLGNSFYGPLFSNQTRLHSTYFCSIFVYIYLLLK